MARTSSDALPAEVATLEQAALAALDRVHTRGVLHDDVKPPNFLRGQRGRVVLTDFEYSELSSSKSGQQAERALVPGFLRRHREMFLKDNLRKPGMPPPIARLLLC